MTPQWIAVFISIAVLFVGLVAHAVSTSWWASRLTTVVELMGKSMEKLALEITAMRELYVTKEVFAEHKMLSETQRAATWKRVDEARDLAQLVAEEQRAHQVGMHRAGV